MMPIRKFSVSEFLSFLISLTGPLTLVVLYAQALIRPQDHASFIFRAGIAIYLIEFLSIHSSGMLLGARGTAHKKKPSRFFLLGLYAVFTLGFMVKLDSWFIGLSFLLSLCAKVFLSRSVREDITRPQIAFSAVNLLFCTFIVVLPALLLKKMFPIPQSLIAEHANGFSGLFVDTPQTLLVWGILYFAITVLFNMLMFFKHTP